MSTHFHFTTRDWMWFCLVFALAIGWGGSFRYNEWLDANTVVVPKGVGISKDDVANPLSHTIQALNTEREQSRELKYLMLRIMSKEQLEKVRRELAELKKSGRTALSEEIDTEFLWATD